MTEEYADYVARAGPRLVRAARLLLHDDGAAEDVTQETLIVVLRRWSHLRDPAAVDAYGHRTLVRQAHRYRRRARFRREMPTGMGPPSGGVRDLASDAAHLSVDLSAMLRGALMKLTRRQREAVVLRFYLDLSVADTARAMGCGPGTVKSQTSKALAALRRHMSETAAHPGHDSEQQRPRSSPPGATHG